MSSGCNFCGSSSSGSHSFLHHMCKYIGQTVTVFSTSGGASGCGFSGVLISVNSDFIRITTQIGTPPANPLSENICGDFDGCDGHGGGGKGYHDDFCSGSKDGYFNVGSVVDIPVNRIAAFCHNAV